MSSIIERIRQRPPVPLSPDTLSAAVAYLRANPDAPAVYVCYDGQTIGEADMQARCRSRTGQLVTIQSIGIPMRVSRSRMDVSQALSQP